jgi:hypothetical protein
MIHPITTILYEHYEKNTLLKNKCSTYKKYKTPVELLILWWMSDRNENMYLAEDHPVIIITKSGFNWLSGFGEN